MKKKVALTHADLPAEMSRAISTYLDVVSFARFRASGFNRAYNDFQTTASYSFRMLTETEDHFKDQESRLTELREKKSKKLTSLLPKWVTDVGLRHFSMLMPTAMLFRVTDALIAGTDDNASFPRLERMMPQIVVGTLASIAARTIHDQNYFIESALSLFTTHLKEGISTASATLLSGGITAGVIHQVDLFDASDGNPLFPLLPVLVGTSVGFATVIWQTATTPPPRLEREAHRLEDMKAACEMAIDFFKAYPEQLAIETKRR